MNAAAVPVLETPRLRLRAHRAGDHAASNALWSAPGVIEHIGGRVFTAEENWRRLLQYRGLWDLLGYGYWAVEDKAGGDYVGDVGFADFAREVTPSLAGMLEAGWVLAPAAQGCGYATEAMGAALAWAAGAFPARRIAALIAPGNRASIRVAEKTGFTLWCKASYAAAPTLIFRRGGE